MSEMKIPDVAVLIFLLVMVAGLAASISRDIAFNQCKALEKNDE